MRHATAGEADRDVVRPLRPEGREEAREMGHWISGLPAGQSPSQVLCSSARRARETYEAMRAPLSAAAGGEPHVSWHDSLYLASPGELLAAIQNLPDDVSSALLIAHEPGVSQLVRGLAGTAAAPLRGRRLAGMMPATIALIGFAERDWRAVAPQTGTWLDLVEPSAR